MPTYTTTGLSCPYLTALSIRFETALYTSSSCPAIYKAASSSKSKEISGYTFLYSSTAIPQTRGRSTFSSTLSFADKLKISSRFFTIWSICTVVRSATTEEHSFCITARNSAREFFCSWEMKELRFSKSARRQDISSFTSKKAAAISDNSFGKAACKVSAFTFLFFRLYAVSSIGLMILLVKICANTKDNTNEIANAARVVRVTIAT